MRKPLRLGSRKYYVVIDSYEKNDNLYVGLYTMSGELFDDLTINIDTTFKLRLGQGFINANIDNNTRRKLVSNGIIKDMLYTFHHGYEDYRLAQFDLDLLKEYDEKGLNNYLKFHKDEYKEYQKRKKEENNEMER